MGKVVPFRRKTPLRVIRRPPSTSSLTGHTGKCLCGWHLPETVGVVHTGECQKVVVECPTCKRRHEMPIRWNRQPP